MSQNQMREHLTDSNSASSPRSVHSDNGGQQAARHTKSVPVQRSSSSPRPTDAHDSLPLRSLRSLATFAEGDVRTTATSSRLDGLQGATRAPIRSGEHRTSPDPSPRSSPRPSPRPRSKTGGASTGVRQDENGGFNSSPDQSRTRSKTSVPQQLTSPARGLAQLRQDDFETPPATPTVSQGHSQNPLIGLQKAFIQPSTIGLPSMKFDKDGNYFYQTGWKEKGLLVTAAVAGLIVICVIVTLIVHAHSASTTTSSSSPAVGPPSIMAELQVLEDLEASNDSMITGDMCADMTIRAKSYSSLCLSSITGNLSIGAHIQLYPCTAADSEQFEFGYDGSLRVVSKPSMCVSAEAPLASGTQLKLSLCDDNSKLVTEQFVVRSDDTIRAKSKSNLCLSAIAGDLNSGTKIELRSCNGIADQQFRILCSPSSRILRHAGDARPKIQHDTLGCVDGDSAEIYAKTAQGYYSCQQIKDRGLCKFNDVKQMCCQTCGPCLACTDFGPWKGVCPDPWKNRTCAQSGNTAFNGASATCDELLVLRKSVGAKCADVRRPGTKTCDTYTQYWANISGGAKPPGSVYPAGYTEEKNARMTPIAIPTNRTMPKEGWPWILHMSFTDPSGDPNAGYNTSSYAGISDQKLYKADIWYGRPAQQEALKVFVEAGFAVVMVGEYMADGNFYSEDKELLDTTNRSCDPSGDKWNMCWNGGKNPDVGYYNAVFDGLAKSKFAAGAKFDMKRMGIVGYSVGCSMASRYFESAMNMKTPSGVPWPVARAAVMVAGGSLNCYNYAPNFRWDWMTTDMYADHLPSNFLPCERPLTVGCCPTNKTEPRFDNGLTPYSEHTPVLLMQTTQDDEADQHASRKYFNAMNNNGGVAFIVRVAGYRHGWTVSEVPPAVNFLTAYVME